MEKKIEKRRPMKLYILYKALFIFTNILFTIVHFHFLLFCYFISDIHECNSPYPCSASANVNIGPKNLGGSAICENTFGGHTCYSKTTGVLCEYYGTRAVLCSRVDKSKWPIKIILLGMLLYSLEFNILFMIKI